MNNKTRVFSAALLTTALASVLTQASGQQVRPDRPPPALAPGRQAPLCDVILEIKSTDMDEQGHLKVGQWLRFLGPLPNQGQILVIPWNKQGAPPHAWRPGAHVAHRTNPPPSAPAGSPPWKYILEVPVLIPPDHPNETKHRYTMTVNAPLEDGCPGNIQFDTLPDPTEITDDHPGHANAD